MSDAREYPHCQAAFINAIREEGTKTEACDWLQKTWNELCAVRKELDSAYLQGRKDMREEAAGVAERPIASLDKLADEGNDEASHDAIIASLIATAIRSIDVGE